MRRSKKLGTFKKLHPTFTQSGILHLVERREGIQTGALNQFPFSGHRHCISVYVRNSRGNIFFFAFLTTALMACVKCIGLLHFTPTLLRRAFMKRTYQLLLNIMSFVKADNKQSVRMTKRHCLISLNVEWTASAWNPLAPQSKLGSIFIFGARGRLLPINPSNPKIGAERSFEIRIISKWFGMKVDSKWWVSLMKSKVLMVFSQHGECFPPNDSASHGTTS